MNNPQHISFADSDQLWNSYNLSRINKCKTMSGKDKEINLWSSSQDKKVNRSFILKFG